LLPLVLALLASVALPRFAQAEGLGLKEYEVPLSPNFKVHGTTKPKHKVSHTESSTDPGTKGSVGGESGGGESQASAEEPEEPQKGEPRSGGAASGGGGGNKPRGGPGGGESAGPHQAGGGKDHVGRAEKVPEGAGVNAAPMEAGREAGIGGGSSPVVLILIAVLVLAAISIGVAYRNQRRSEEGLGGRPHSA
jgi:hypothetical protein